jgi:hypothetical protein
LTFAFDVLMSVRVDSFAFAFSAPLSEVVPVSGTEWRLG